MSEHPPELPSLKFKIGERLREVRRDKGWSQKKAAAELGMSRANTIGEYERGEVEPSVSQIRFLCDGYGVSADVILGLPPRALREHVSVPRRDLDELQRMLRRLSDKISDLQRLGAHGSLSRGTAAHGGEDHQ